MQNRTGFREWVVRKLDGVTPEGERVDHRTEMHYLYYTYNLLGLMDLRYGQHSRKVHCMVDMKDMNNGFFNCMQQFHACGGNVASWAKHKESTMKQLADIKKRSEAYEHQQGRMTAHPPD